MNPDALIRLVSAHTTSQCKELAQLVDGQHLESLKLFGRKVVPSLYSDAPHCPALARNERSDILEDMRPVMLGHAPSGKTPDAVVLLCMLMLHYYRGGDIYPAFEDRAIARLVEHAVSLGNEWVVATYEFLRWLQQDGTSEPGTIAFRAAGCAMCLVAMLSDEYRIFVAHAPTTLHGHATCLDDLPAEIDGDRPWRGAWQAMSEYANAGRHDIQQELEALVIGKV
ncbi:hypothetical protein RAS1_16910 [Phycisphaerae bacterium RAS1]|nr:hypothetical protein RAS1_16910 [Phycisphaerae bacterium RAS1]